MEITVNDKKQIIEERTVLSDIVFLLNGEKNKGIAVALNNVVIPKNLWNETIINENDNILIIKATQGG